MSQLLTKDAHTLSSTYIYQNIQILYKSTYGLISDDVNERREPQHSVTLLWIEGGVKGNSSGSNRFGLQDFNWGSGSFDCL